MELKVQVIGNALLRIGQSVLSFVSEVKTLAEDARVQAILAEFPGGTEADKACIKLCNDTEAAVKVLVDSKIPNAEKAVGALYDQLAADIARIKHNNPKHTAGYYLKLVGVVLEDLASRL